MIKRSPIRAFAATAGCWLAAMLLLGLSSPAVADYRLQAGDVIEISVVGLPELHQQLTVQMDGSIAIPRVGTLEVEGTSLGAARSSIQSAFASRLFTLSAPDGREVMRTVERHDVAVGISRYRPIWVSGDVVQPGEKPFQPRMTVRQAIASAGGLRRAVARSSGPTYDALALQNEYASRWLALAAQAVRHWRLRTELGDDADFDTRTLPPAPVSGEPLSRILAIEKELRESRRLDHEREGDFLERAASLAEEEIASLSEQLKIEEQGVLDDQEEYERAKDLLDKGRLTNTRVVDARRSLLYSSTRKLQTANNLMQARRRLSEHLRALERIEDRRRISVFEELQVAELKLAEERTRLRGVEEKLNVAGISVAGVAEPSGGADITLIRRAADGPRTVQAGYDDEVMPGDVVEVVWQQRGAMQQADIHMQTSELRQDPPRTD